MARGTPRSPIPPPAPKTRTYPQVQAIQDRAAQSTIQLLWQQVYTLQDALDALTRAHGVTAADLATARAQLAATTKLAQQASGASGIPVSAQASPAPIGGDGSGGGDGQPLPPPPPDYLTAVQVAKADLITAGVPLAGPCGAFQITKLVTYRLKDTDPSIGLLLKSSGNNCDGYATAIVNFLGGRIVDILADDGGANTPQWAVLNESRPATQWSAPIPGAIP